jgi:hypothetical protein
MSNKAIATKTGTTNQQPKTKALNVLVEQNN